MATLKPSQLASLAKLFLQKHQEAELEALSAKEFALPYSGDGDCSRILASGLRYDCYFPEDTFIAGGEVARTQVFYNEEPPNSLSSLIAQELNLNLKNYSERYEILGHRNYLYNYLKDKKLIYEFPDNLCRGHVIVSRPGELEADFVKRRLKIENHLNGKFTLEEFAKFILIRQDGQLYEMEGPRSLFIKDLKRVIDSYIRNYKKN